uniref:Transposase Tc1-like domain-containing protein n=1 Tax=Bionectria ochroleuca TaxID=29856 RepID=A0A8H7K3L4_BIOOC
MSSNSHNFGAITSANRQKNHELSSELRAAICAAFSEGQSKSAIARKFNVSRIAVFHTIERFNQTESLESLPRSGRPKSLTSRDTRVIIRSVRLDFRTPRKSLVTAQGLQVSLSTARRALDDEKLREIAATRLQFAQDWRGRDDELLTIIFSDECSVQNSSSNPDVWVWRYSHEAYDPKFVNLEDHGKPTIRIMVWAAIWDSGRTDLVIMTRDELAKKK